MWAVCVWGSEDAGQAMKEPYLTVASYVFGALLVALIVVGCLELVGVVRVPE